MGGKALNGKTIANQEAHNLFSALVKDNSLTDKSSKIMLCGSARRGKPTCGDLDIVFIDKDDQVKSWLTERFGLKKNGKPQTVGLVDGVQVEFYESTEEAWGSQTLMWTGSASNNIRLRRICKKRGWSMSQYGIKDKNKENLTANMSEEEIYNFLGVDFVIPEDR